jgi:adenine deaminase
MAASAEGIPLNVFFMIPSCVPATHMETAGAVLRAEDIRALLREPWALGLAEMMNFPGVIHGDPEVLKKIEAAEGKRIDGHAPFLSGKALSAYVAAGIRSDHEATTLKEAKEKLNRGMWIMAREGTTARNLKDLIHLVTPENSRRFLLVTDDRHPKELLEEGHIDSVVRKAVHYGIDPVLAIQMATLNAAEYFRLEGLGAIAPGFRADLVVFDHLARFQVKKVLKDGVLVAENGKMVRGSIAQAPSRKNTSSLARTIRIKALSLKRLALRSDTPVAKVIQLIPNQIITKKVIRRIPLREGIAHPDIKEDILKLVVIERHQDSGNIGIGFVEGFGLKKGAIGSSVAHDSHNLIIVGTNDQDILETGRRIEAMGGGMAVVSGGKVLTSLPLPIAGLMSDASVQGGNHQLEKLNVLAKRIGCLVPDPFMVLSFLALPVIPELKLTDRGLVDVNQFKIVPLFGEE